MKVVILTVFALCCLFIQLASSQVFVPVPAPGFGTFGTPAARSPGSSLIFFLLLFFIIIPFLFNSGSSDQIILLNGTLSGNSG